MSFYPYGIYRYKVLRIVTWFHLEFLNACADLIALIVETMVFDHLVIWQIFGFWWSGILTESIKERKVNSPKFSLIAEID